MKDNEASDDRKKYDPTIDEETGSTSGGEKPVFNCDHLLFSGGRIVIFSIITFVISLPFQHHAVNNDTENAALTDFFHGFLDHVVWGEIGPDHQNESIHVIAQN